ncbi:MAG: sugar ABC transporter permease [Lachnospiraceae bacterium]|nr:sugar ABC transporter permease [Lachnospiraceae bacterium]
MTGKERIANYMYFVVRIATLLSVVMVFFPAFNPGKISGLINKNMSLFTTAIAYDSLVENCVRAFDKGWVSETSFIILFVSCMLLVIGIVGAVAMACMSLGNNKFKKFGNWFGFAGALLQIGGLVGIYVAYTQMAATDRPEKVEPAFATAIWMAYMVLAAIILILLIAIQILLPKVEKSEKFEMLSKYKLFLMFMPFAALTFVFSYLPLYGWRYAFYDYKAGGTLSADNFVGFKWFTMLFESEATRGDIVRVLRNTLAMSGLGIGTSWCAMAFAIFLNEIKSVRVKRFVQTFTTIPNFISWVLVYAIAFSIFSTDGFISNLLVNAGVWESGVNMLMGDDHIWLKMLAWGMWKGIGWSAIIYIAGISGIDQQLYEAATVDGAGRFQKMWHITVPGLTPTYMVLLLMSVAGILSNGMDQYLVFANPTNTHVIEVLDLYVYKLGIEGGSIPLSTMVGMVKSVVSVVLLFGANTISKVVRGESIV